MKKILKYKYDISMMQGDDPQQTLPTTPPMTTTFRPSTEMVVPIKDFYLNCENVDRSSTNLKNVSSEIQLTSNYHQQPMEFDKLVSHEFYLKNYHNNIVWSSHEDFEYLKERNGMNMRILDDFSQKFHFDDVKLPENYHGNDLKIVEKSHKKEESESKCEKLNLLFCAFCLNNFKFRTNLLKHIKSKHKNVEIDAMSNKEMEKFIITNKNFNNVDSINFI